VSRRLDPLGPLLAILAGALATLRGFDGELSRDLGLYMYAGQRVADGVPPYVGVMNRSGPLAHLAPGLGAWLGDRVGVDDLLAVRVLMLVVSMLVVWLTYLLCRDVFGSRAVGAAAALFLGTVPAFVLYAVGGPRDKTTMMLFLTATLLAVVHRRWAAAGTYLALATLTWQPVFFPGVATVAVAALMTTGRRGRAVVAVGAAGALTSLVFVVGFALAGALPEALDGFVRIHLRYTYQPGLSDDPENTWKAFEEAYGFATYLLLAGLAALILVALPGLLRLVRRRTTPEGRARDVGLVALAAGEAVGLAWSWRTFNGFADALVLVPYAVVGFGGVLALGVGRLPRRAGLAVAVGVCLLLLTAGANSAVTERDRVLVGQRAEVDAVLDVLPDASMLSIEAPQPLVLAHRVNPSEHQMFRLGLETYVDRTWPGGLEGYAAWIAKTRPTIVVVGRGARYDWLMPTLDADYVEFGTSTGWYWYVDRDTDPRTLARLEEAVDG
jgi:MFS family permease